MSLLSTPKNLIDIHSHILPDLDDGSLNVAETKEMLKQAYKDGIRTIIATPHFNEVRGQIATKMLSRTRFDAIRKYVNEYQGMKLYLGQEVCYSKNSMKLLADGILSTLAGTNYILLEYGPKVTRDRILYSLQDALGHGYIPIIAHPERYYCVADGAISLQECIDAGAYIQLNAESVTGKHGKNTQKWALEQISNGCVHFIATDAHSSKNRKPQLSAAYRQVENKIGTIMAKKIFIKNPGMLLKNNYLD